MTTGKDFARWAPARQKPAFSKRHYEAIASVLAEARANLLSDPSTIDCIVADFSMMFARDSTRYDGARFERACEK